MWEEESRTAAASEALPSRAPDACSPWGDHDAQPLAAHGPSAALASAVDDWVQHQLDALRGQAEMVQAQLEEQLRTHGASRHRSERGKIGVRIRVQPSPPATPGTFTIEWCTYSYANTAKGQQCFSTYVAKGAGDRYAKSAFAGLVRNWQRPLVDEAETHFARIRRVVRLVSGVRTQLRAAVRAERALDAAVRADRSAPWT